MGWTKDQYMKNPPGFNEDMFMAIMETRKEEARRGNARGSNTQRRH